MLGSILVENESLIGKSGSSVEFTDDIGERVYTSRQCNRIILAQRNCETSQPFGFGEYPSRDRSLSH